MNTLTETELAGLDLIIAAKKAGTLAAGFINDIAAAAVAVQAVANAAAAVAAVAAGPIISPAAAGAPAGASTGAGTGGAGISLDGLMEIRRQALDAKNAGNP